MRSRRTVVWRAFVLAALAPAVATRGVDGSTKLTVDPELVDTASSRTGPRLVFAVNVPSRAVR